MEDKVIELINKYKVIVNTLISNRDIKKPGDYYPYNMDIKLTSEVIKDLNSILDQK